MKYDYIQIKNLYKTYVGKGTTVEVLKGVDLAVKKGEIFGIIGFSGAGKSTLARCINQLEIPDKGEILVDGVDIIKLTKKELLKERRKIGMVFQTFNLFEAKTVYHNISYPLEISNLNKDKIREWVLETGQLVGLSG